MSPAIVVVMAAAGGVVGIVAEAVAEWAAAGTTSTGPRPPGTVGAPGRQRGGAVVVVCSALFVAGGLRFDGDRVLPAYLFLFTALVAISVVDLERHLVPNRLLYPAVLTSLALLAGAAGLDADPGRLLRALGGAAAAWTALLCFHLLSPDDSGFGDVRLALLLGLFLGWLGPGQVVIGLFAGFVLAAVVGVSLVVAGIRRRSDPLPLAPFLSAGAVFAILAGGPVLRLWLG